MKTYIYYISVNIEMTIIFFGKNIEMIIIRNKSLNHHV